MRSWHRRIVLAIVFGLLASLPAFSASALAPQSSAFQRTWERTDQDPTVRPYRTWIWGPQAFSALMWEAYDEAPDGMRLVQYFDKSRMEDNSYREPNAPWDVSNGLLVNELISGRMQIGDNNFEEREPASVNVAGDADDTAGPTYSTFTDMLALAPYDAGTTITQRLARDGTISNDPSLAQYGVTAAELVDLPGIRHRVASPFWTFMTSQGQVYENGSFANANLFENPYYATGLPITEAYWANVKVGNVQRDVLMQCFERRCLTYTPSNSAEWQVEMGNVGMHYYAWRHGVQVPDEPPAITDSNYKSLNPAPLAGWPFDLDQQAWVLLQNDSPYTMQVTFDGPTSQTVTVDPNPGGIVYPNDGAFQGCNEEVPVGDIMLPPGNYRVKFDYLGGNVAPGRDYWTLIPDALYSGCYYVVVDSGASSAMRAITTAPVLTDN
jgi:hypothetical protein